MKETLGGYPDNEPVEQEADTSGLDDDDFLNSLGGDYDNWDNTLEELEGMYGGRIFTYGSYSGTVRSMMACPAFGEMLDQGTAATAAWLEANDQPEGESKDEPDDPQAAESTEAPATDTPEPSGKESTVQEKQPTVSPVAANKDVSETQRSTVTASKTDIPKVAPTLSLAEDNATGAEIGIVLETEKAAVEVVESSLDEIHPDAMPVELADSPDRGDLKAEDMPETEQPVTTDEMPPVENEIIPGVATEVLLLENPDEPSVVDEDVRDTDNTEKSMFEEPMATLDGDVPSPDTAISEVEGKDEYKETTSTELETSDLDKAADIEVNSEVPTRELQETAPVPSLDDEVLPPSYFMDSTDTVEDSIYGSEDNYQAVPMPEEFELPSERDEEAIDAEVAAESIFEKVITNELDDAGSETIVDDSLDKVLEVFVEITDETPETRPDIDPVDLYYQLSKTVEKLDMLQVAQSAEDCQEALMEIRLQLIDLLRKLGYANAESIANGLTKKYDVDTLKTYMALLIESILAQKDVDEPILPSSSKHSSLDRFGRAAVGKVVQLTSL